MPSFPSDTYLNEFRQQQAPIAQEFEHLYAQLQGYLSVDHKPNGQHKNVRALSIRADEFGLLTGETFGEWVTPAYSLLTWTASSGSSDWTVASGDVTYLHYAYLSATQVQIKGALVTTTVANTPSELRLDFDASEFVFGGNDSQGAMTYTQNNFTSDAVGQVYARSGTSRLAFKVASGTNWSNTTNQTGIIFNIIARVVAPVLVVLLASSVSSACASTAWSDDFESASALSSDYTNIADMVKSSGVGSGGSQGIEGSGTSAQQYYAEMTKVLSPAPNSRQGCYALDYKLKQSIDQGGHYLVEVRDSNDNTHFGIYSGGSYAGSPSFGDITVYDTGFASIADVTGVFTDGVYATMLVTWELSSISGGARQADGWIKVYRDGSLIVNLSGLTIGTYHAVSNPNNYWDRVHFAPQGAGDYLEIGTP